MAARQPYSADFRTDTIENSRRLCRESEILRQQSKELLITAEHMLKRGKLWQEEKPLAFAATNL
jgi:hypothetical protein